MKEECFFTKCTRPAKHTIRLVNAIEHSYCELHFTELKMEGLLFDVTKEQKEKMRKQYYSLKYGER